MNSNFPNSPEDCLLDELLRERTPDEAFLRDVEEAIDAPVAKSGRPGFYRNLGIAAALALAAGGILWSSRDKSNSKIATTNSASPILTVAESVPDLDEAIREQEAVVKERAKVLATMSPPNGMRLGGQDDAIKRGLDAQDYHDVKRDYEASREHLLDLKMKKLDQRIASAGKDGKEGFASAPPPANSVVAALERKAALRSEPAPVRTVAAAAQAANAVPEIEPFGDMSTLSSLSGSNGLRSGDTLSLGFGEGAGRGFGAGSGTRLGRASETAGLDASPLTVRPRIVPPPSGKLFGLVPSDRPDELRGNIRPEPPSGDQYGQFIDQPWKSPTSDPLSTFSIDVDTASYSNVRRMIQEGRQIPRDAVRIEECINAFDYNYAQPEGGSPFAVRADIANCPWADGHQLVRVAIKGRDIAKNQRPASNLVFLIDVSGSMNSPDKLPLLKQSMATLVDQLDERDRVAIVVYAGSEGVALPSTTLDDAGKKTVQAALAKLESGGSTNGGAGIQRAYDLAMAQKIDGGVNRVILATDGDFNVGVTGQAELVDMVKSRAKGGVYLTVLGFGAGNLNDAMMDAITRDGNGNYYYIDSEREGRKVFLQKLSGTLVTIAKDVKIQVEFNPARVGQYRLIGYANRVLKNEDFANDKVDAGDIGAGHTVTAFYEIMPPGAATDGGLKYQTAATPAPAKPAVSDEWLTVKLRYKHPDGDISSKIELPLKGDALQAGATDPDFQFAAAAALFGMKLRGMDEAAEVSWQNVINLAQPGLANDPSEERAEFVSLLRRLAD